MWEDMKAGRPDGLAAALRFKIDMQVGGGGGRALAGRGGTCWPVGQSCWSAGRSCVRAGEGVSLGLMGGKC